MTERKEKPAMKRVFILGKQYLLDSVNAALYVITKRGALEIVTSTSYKEYRESLPKNYDLYLIHLQHTSEEALKELKQEQPWSKVIGAAALAPNDELASMTMVRGAGEHPKSDFYLRYQGHLNYLDGLVVAWGVDELEPVLREMEVELR